MQDREKEARSIKQKQHEPIWHLRLIYTVAKTVIKTTIYSNMKHAYILSTATFNFPFLLDEKIQQSSLKCIAINNLVSVTP